MKNKIKLLLFCISSNLLQASVTLTATAENIQDASGFGVEVNRLALLVVSTSDQTFGSVQAGNIFINNTADDIGFIDNSDDAIIAHFATEENGFSLIKQASIGVTLGLDGRFSSGDRFAIYWFPTIIYDANISNIVFNAGDTYGIVFSGTVQDFGTDEGNGVDIDWILPSEGNSPIYLNSSAGPAIFTVADAIPEPSSIALICLGAFGLIARRRRVTS